MYYILKKKRKKKLMAKVRVKKRVNLPIYMIRCTNCQMLYPVTFFFVAIHTTYVNYCNAEKMGKCIMPVTEQFPL